MPINLVKLNCTLYCVLFLDTHTETLHIYIIQHFILAAERRYSLLEAIRSF